MHNTNGSFIHFSKEIFKIFIKKRIIYVIAL